MMMAKKSPREHIEEIRRLKFSIGAETSTNPVMEDLHQVLKSLSEELRSSDVHLLMDLIQNAEDNEYPDDVQPLLEFIITSKDITETGASATLLVFNNENGFSEKNIDSICSIGRSTKKGNRQCGYIGEKGIGFKSVFLFTSQPYIFSNGYQIRFDEKSMPVGYIVPEWVEKPILCDIHQIYGSNRTFPTTTIVLPLKSAKVQAVKQQLSSIYPEVLLFLPKIKQLIIREDNDEPRLSTINSVSISSETEFHTRKSSDAESYTLHLYAEDNHLEQDSECSYYVWRQKFPVRMESREERRMEVEEWVISIAFPYGQRQNRGMTLPDIYAFLPTGMVSNFPFIIQADFILTSSRETIVFDNKWNIGILDCISSAFASAFVSIVTASKSAPLSSLFHIFQFLPLNNPSYPVLNDVKDAIKLKLFGEDIILFESSMQEKVFCKPVEMVKVMPAFWDILLKAEIEGVRSPCLSLFRSRYILNSTYDDAKYDAVFEFLGVEPVDGKWYLECIQNSNLVLGVSEDVYMELLCFFAENWNSLFQSMCLLKYMDEDGGISSWSISWVSQFYGPRLCFSSNPDHVSWLSTWNLEFRCAADWYFMPKRTQEALDSFPKSSTIKEWLWRQASVEPLSVHDYAAIIASALKDNRTLIISFTHFLYHSFERNYLSDTEVCLLCDSMPLVDSSGCVITQRRAVLVPANGSKWAGLLGSNPWKSEDYLELGEEYLTAGDFGGLHSSEKQLMQFLVTHMKASDIPDLCPPDAAFCTVSSPLTKENTFLLLDWIQHLNYKGVKMPGKFLQCIKDGSWLKTLFGSSPPSKSALYSTEWESLSQIGFAQGDIPFIDEEFYDHKISHYKEELKIIGVICEFENACEYIARHLMTLASSRIAPSKMLLLLNFIRYLMENLSSPEGFINSIKKGRWLRTTHGYRTPVGSVLFDGEWKLASEISNPPFISIDYGEEILSYRTELQLLGVVVGFNQNYQLVADHFQLPFSFTSVTANSVLLMLACIRHSRSSQQLVEKLKNKRWLRTNLGYRLPEESFLFNHEWGCLLTIFHGIPLIDENFYGSNIRMYIGELEEIGVVVTFQEASKAVTRRFKELISSYSVTGNNVLSLLDCYRYFKGTKRKFPSELEECILEERWLWTRLGYRSPNESILLDAEWESVSPIVSLPFIDDIDEFYGSRIYEYRDELKHFGAVLEFNKGSELVARGLNIRDPSDVTPTTALTLLKCIRNILKLGGPLPDEFMERINVKWVKTLIGFRSPCESILFDSNWESLHLEEVAFIDEEFYGTEISSYRNELKAIGVIVEVEHYWSLLSSDRDWYSHFTRRLGPLKASIEACYKKFQSPWHRKRG